MFQREINALVMALTRTPEFQRLAKIRKAVLDDPKLGPQVRAFEQESQRSAQSGDPKRMEQLAARNRALFNTPQVAEFMSAFTAFNKVMGQAMQQIYKAIDGRM